MAAVAVEGGDELVGPSARSSGEKGVSDQRRRGSVRGFVHVYWASREKGRERRKQTGRWPRRSRARRHACASRQRLKSGAPGGLGLQVDRPGGLPR